MTRSLVNEPCTHNCDLTHVQDLFMRKVRQFQFDIRNLFGTMKPFSCDVEIKYADQVLILPIEVQVCA